MVKDEICPVVSNLKLNIASFKINSNVIEEFFMLTIDNKYAKNALILQFLLGALASSIAVPGHFFYWRVENPNSNNVSNKNKVEKEIKLEDKMN